MDLTFVSLTVTVAIMAFAIAVMCWAWLWFSDTENGEKVLLFSLSVICTFAGVRILLGAFA